jgi:hypothetical protein
MIATYKEATEPRVSSGKVEIITLKIYGQQLDLVHRNGIYVSELTKNMFCFW